MIEAAEVKPGDRVLEIGAGSGYAAAVLGQIAAQVQAIERHPSLAEAAERRIEALGYGNVFIHVGDGTKGWPEAAPYDAILVAAGGPDVPDALMRQLKIGGRLVIPVGSEERAQTLMKLVRQDELTFESEDLGAVRFVPLIGEQGWTEDGRRAASNHLPGRSRGRTLPEMIADAAEPLPDFDDPAFARLFDRFADRRVVLLGEASHGTSEFYRARAAITQHLIARHGFTIVAVEADWPDAAAVDRHVRHRPAPAARAAVPALPDLDVAQCRGRGIHRWMRAHNEGVAERERQAGLRARHLQYERPDRGGARLSRHGRPGGRQGGARALWLPHAVAEGASDLWAGGAHRRLSQMRGGGDRAMPRDPGASAGLWRGGQRQLSMRCRMRG